MTEGPTDRPEEKAWFEFTDGVFFNQSIRILVGNGIRESEAELMLKHAWTWGYSQGKDNAHLH